MGFSVRRPIRYWPIGRSAVLPFGTSYRGVVNYPRMPELTVREFGVGTVSVRLGHGPSTGAILG
jgi:hypothetical protein